MLNFHKPFPDAWCSGHPELPVLGTLLLVTSAPCCLKEDRQTSLWSSKEAPVFKSNQVCSQTLPPFLKTPEPSRGFTDALAAELTS